MVKQIDSPIKFGTDGWRGIIAQDFTFDNVRVCAQGVADYIKQTGLASRGLIIGYDTRFASEDFASAAAEVVAGNGIKVYLCPKATPTPVISYGILARKAGGAIIITASHNPAKWNGFKVKAEYGASAPPKAIAEIEKNISRTLATGKVNKVSLTQALKQGTVEHLNLAPIYIDHLTKLIDLNELRQARLKVVIDPMYGAGTGYFKTLLDNGAIEITEINNERNPLFAGIQPE
ncbi:phosphoglucomutase/phosphomannomutase family protein, partial [Chloroflexota bacterium]